jgi:hypothetical protein
LSGAVAQYGRGVGVVQATAAQIMTQFANNLKAQLAKQAPAAAAPAVAATSGTASTPAASTPGTPPPVKPISGFSLMARVLWDWIVRLFRRRSN